MCHADTSGVAPQKSKYVNELKLFQQSCNSFAVESVPGLNTDSTSQRGEKKKDPLGRPLSDQNRTKANRTEIPRAHFLAVGEKRHSSLFLPNRSHVVRVFPHRPPTATSSLPICNLNSVQRVQSRNRLLPSRINLMNWLSR